MSDALTPDDPGRAREAFGEAALAPRDDVACGAVGTWTVEVTAGALGVDDGGTVLVVFSQTSDLERPQVDDPAGDAVCSATAPDGVEATARFDPDAFVRPWKHGVRVDLAGGALAPGDRLEVVLGDRSGGGRGLRAQTFPEAGFRFGVLVDCHGTGEFEPLPGALSFDVVPADAVGLAAVAPSTVAPGAEATVRARAVDRWGNVDPDADATLAVETEAGARVADLDLEAGTGAAAVPVEDAGVHRFVVRDPDRDWAATTNPVEAADRERATYWADLHGQSGETVGTGTVRAYLAHARDHAFVDAASHAANDFQVTDEVWAEIRAACRAYHEPGAFVTFPGYEWSANTSLGGDHNVYFRDDDATTLERSSHWQVAEGAARADGLRPVEALYERFRGRDDVLVIPHQGGRPATLEGLDPDLTPFVEVASVWGHFEWFGREALAAGHPVGFVGGSDDHCGRPGDAPPDELAKHNVSGGLMAVDAGALTREALWAAMRERRVYATSGARVGLDLEVAGAPMGAETTADGPVDVACRVRGTAPVAGVDLFRDDARLATRAFDEDDVPADPGVDDCLVELSWTGSRGRARDKLVDWSGGATLDRGAVVDTHDFGFDHPDQGLVERTERGVRWDAATSGNRQGVRLDVDAPAGATLAVETATADLAVALEDLDAPVEVDAGPVECALRARRVGAPTARDVTAAWTDDDPPDGTAAYWVRVRQVDGEVAWSSPTFVDAS